MQFGAFDPYGEICTHSNVRRDRVTLAIEIRDSRANFIYSPRGTYRLEDLQLSAIAYLSRVK